jgi:hypothetical protein
LEDVALTSVWIGSVHAGRSIGATWQSPCEESRRQVHLELFD